LLPVADVALYITPTEKHDELIHEGHNIYSKSIKCEIFGNVRSKTDEFSSLLRRIREKCVTQQDIALLETRLEDNLSEAELERFEDSLHLFGETRLVDMHNNYYVMKKDVGMVYIKAVMSIDCSDCAANISGLFVSSGFKCTFTQNISTKLGVVNGQVCYIEHLVYKTSQTDEPDFLVVRIEDGKYRGRGLNGSSNLISIFPMKLFEYCKHKAENYTVTRYPLKLNYGSTIHKVIISYFLIARPSD